MKRKEFGFANWDPLQQPAPEPTSPQSVDADTYGDPQREQRKVLKSSRQVAKPIDIVSIYPDPAQPRRALPSEIRASWDGDPAHLASAFDTWMTAIEAETGRRYDLAPLLTGSGVRPLADDESDDLSALEAALLRLIDLASSIYHDGLLNPITVGAANDVYVIETGERRWLAFHLLFAALGDDRFSKIPATEVTPNVWRQANENSARDNLNAVARARQYAILMMDLLAETTPFRLYDECESDRAFYAQVLGLRVPTGQNERLLSALGVTSRSALSRYRDILGLSDDDWLRADDQNLSERELFRTQNNVDSAQPASQRRAAPASFIERTANTFSTNTLALTKIEQQIAKHPNTDFTALEPLIDAQIDKLRALKRRLRK